MSNIYGKTDNGTCFLCAHKFSRREESSMLFKAFTLRKLKLTTTFSKILSSVLNIKMEKKSIHSTLLCNTCKNLMLEFINKEHEWNKLRNDIVAAYKRTIDVYNLKPKNLNSKKKPNKILDNPESSTNVKTNTKNNKRTYHHDKQNEILKEEFINETTMVETELDPLYVEMSTSNTQRVLKSNKIKKKVIKEVELKKASADSIENIENNSSDDNSMEKPYKCEKCNKIFGTKGSYVRHVQLYDEHYKKRYKCDMCDKHFAFETNLKIHKKLIHDRRNRYFCAICNKGYYEKLKFKEHKKNHSDIEVFYYHCELCNKILCKKSDLKRHKKLFCEKALKVQKNNNCETCGKKFLTKIGLGLHIIDIHLKKKETQMKCKICDRTFGNKNFLKEHTRGHTGRERRVKCVECNIRVSKTFISKHKMIHFLSKVVKQSNSEKVIPQTKCSICGKNHKNFEKSKHYPCAHCDKIYLTENHLYMHGKRAHGIENIVYDVLDTLKKVYDCSECGKSFAADSTLQQHMKIHNIQNECNENELNLGEACSNSANGFKCDKCLKTFNSYIGFQNHMKLHNEILYECDICKVNFLQNFYLLKHKRMHINRNKRPTYECDICHRKFYHIKNLKQHRSVHSPTVYKCNNCDKEFAQYRYLKQHQRRKQCPSSFNILTKRTHLQCKICDKRFKLKHRYDEHQGVHVDISEYKYNCEKCDKKFYTISGLSKHSKMHIKKFQCDICQKKFNYKSQMEEHKDFVHMGIKKQFE